MSNDPTAVQTLDLPNQQAAAGDLILCVHDILGRLLEAPCSPIRPLAVGAWTPEPQRCHDNVAHWVRIHPESAAIHGWLYMDMSLICAAAGVPRWLDLLPHSVVRLGDRRLVDITPRHPLASSDPYPFIAHPGTDEEYFAFVDGRSIARVRIYVDESPLRIVYAPN
jgi:hypothetical protein